MVILRVSAKNYCFRFSEAKSCRIEILWKRKSQISFPAGIKKKKKQSQPFIFIV